VGRIVFRESRELAHSDTTPPHFPARVRRAQDPDHDLADIGIESRLIPYLTAVKPGERRAIDPNPLSAEDAQVIADTLDEVNPSF